MSLYSYGSARNLYGDLTGDTTAANLAIGDALINADLGQVWNSRPWPFRFVEATTLTVASQQYIGVPAKFDKILSVKVTSGTTVFTPKEAPNREFWDRLNSSTSVTSDFPHWWYTFGGRVHFYPTPSTARTATLFGRKRFQGISVSEYTTGTILTATQGSTRLVASSTGWATSMNGRSIKIFESNSPNKGDGEWYEIESVVDATNLTLAKPYEGLAIASGTAAYVIGQLIPLPDGYGEIPIYRAVSKFFMAASPPNRSIERSAFFKELGDDLYANLVSEYGSESDSVIADDAAIDEVVNPNLQIQL